MSRMSIIYEAVILAKGGHIDIINCKLNTVPNELFREVLFVGENRLNWTITFFYIFKTKYEKG